MIIQLSTSDLFRYYNMHIKIYIVEQAMVSSSLLSNTNRYVKIFISS